MQLYVVLQQPGKIGQFPGETYTPESYGIRFAYVFVMYVPPLAIVGNDAKLDVKA